ncbi:MAG: acyl carrier protein [Acidobacteria bacterium]|nr:MAG: acyl carrier protein [Acidobacteriota bacterium]
MDREQIATQVIARIAKMQKTSPDKISVDSTFEELGVDSLNGLELLWELEEELEIVIPDDDAREIAKVSDVIAVVEPLLAKKS